MFYWMNMIDTALAKIEAIENISQRLQPQPYAHSVWQVMTDERTKRVLRAIGVAMLVLLTILLLGLVKVVRLAWQEAVEIFQHQMKSDIPSLNTSGTVEKPAPPLEIHPKADVLTVKTGVRALRKIATQRGIQNAGRMRKAELLARLEITQGATALEG